MEHPAPVSGYTPDRSLEITILKVRTVVEEAGYRCPEMCSPEERLETDK